MNLYGANHADVVLKNGKHVQVEQQTDYPWNGKIKLILTPETPEDFAVMLRIPGWVNSQPVPSDLYTYTRHDKRAVKITINGKPRDFVMEKGYAVLSGSWKRGDTIELSLPMDVHKVSANDKVAADVNHLAVERGR